MQDRFDRDDHEMEARNQREAIIDMVCELCRIAAPDDPWTAEIEAQVVSINARLCLVLGIADTDPL